jgi:pimeloyl-ACP methyl ester carboxylesterase
MVLAVPAIAAIGFGMGSSWVERLIFQPSPGVDVTPEQLRIDARELFLETEDGVRIHAYELPCQGASRALLFLHGNAGNASHRLPNAAALARLGVHVLLLDYRGYGRSEGTPTELGSYADARAGLRHLVETRGFAPARVVLFGRSLGGTVAVDLAQDRPLAGVILESTFTSTGDVARGMLGPPGAWLAGNRFAAVEKIGALRSPLLFFHGDRDRIIPIGLGRRLFAAAPQPKSFEVITGAGHNDTVLVGGAPYFERIRQFLDRVAPEPAAGKPDQNPPDQSSLPPPSCR